MLILHCTEQESLFWEATEKKGRTSSFSEVQAPSLGLPAHLSISGWEWVEGVSPYLNSLPFKTTWLRMGRRCHH